MWSQLQQASFGRCVSMTLKALLIATPPVEQDIVINVIFTGKLCRANAGMHRLHHQCDFEVAGEVGTSWVFGGDSDFTGSRGYGKTG